MTDYLEKKSVADDLIYLLSCSVNQTTPDTERVSEMDLDAVYELATRHMVGATAAFALDACHITHPAFAETKAKSLRKTVLFEAERRQMFSMFEAQGIWYLPLKGTVLKDDYPSFGMREMADNDILCDPERMDDVRRIMKTLGYRCEVHAYGKDDDYFKPPVLNFEMHRRLFTKGENEIFWQYFSDVYDRSTPVGNDPFARQMPDELFYLYLLAHEYKHYISGGTGIRSLLDVYVFLKKHGDSMDQKKLASGLEALKLTEFEAMNREMSFALFSSGEISEEYSEPFAEFLSSGTFGTMEKATYYSLNRALDGDDSAKAKRRHLKDRIFLTDEAIREMYPFFHKHKIFLPFLFIFRLFRAAFCHPMQTLRDYKNIKDFKKE